MCFLFKWTFKKVHKQQRWFKNVLITATVAWAQPAPCLSLTSLLCIFNELTARLLSYNFCSKRVYVGVTTNFRPIYLDTVPWIHYIKGDRWNGNRSIELSYRFVTFNYIVLWIMQVITVHRFLFLIPIRNHHCYHRHFSLHLILIHTFIHS